MTLTQYDFDFLNKILLFKLKDISDIKRFLEVEEKIIFNNKVVKRLKEIIKELSTSCDCDDCILQTDLIDKLQNIWDLE